MWGNWYIKVIGFFRFTLHFVTLQSFGVSPPTARVPRKLSWSFQLAHNMRADLCNASTSLRWEQYTSLRPLISLGTTISSLNPIYPNLAERPACFLLFMFCFAYSSSLKMETTFFSETSVDFHHPTRCYITEDRTLHNHRCERVKFYNTYIIGVNLYAK
jgi:hypothetical protein